MMKENSPICVSEKLHCMARCKGCPAMTKANVPKKAIPTKRAREMRRMGSPYWRSTCGSTSIPTDTKNTAPKRSRTGFTSFSMRSASMVSANMLPITKAPKAALNPAFAASTTSPKHKPMLTTRRISELMILRFFFKK